MTELVGRRDAERAHEVRHVETVGAARAGVLLAGKPDFFGNRYQVGQAGELAGAGGRGGKAGHADPHYHVLFGRG